MADWLEQYTAALDIRDAREQAHKSYIEAYTKLADRTALLEASGTSTTAAPPEPSASPVGSKLGSGKTASKRSPSGTASPEPGADILSRLRPDLASTQRSRTELQTQLTRLQSQLDQMTDQSTVVNQRVTILEREKRDLERKLRDRDEELRGKARLVESVQDEMVGLNLQMNMAEEKAERLKGENEDLVRRWMERMGMEADRMNTESRWK